MKSSRNPSPLPVVPWLLATVLALADVILRVAKPYVIPETLIVPVAVTLLLSAVTGYKMYRYQKETTVRASASLQEEDQQSEE